MLSPAGYQVAALDAGSSPSVRAGAGDDVLVIPGRGLQLPQQLPFERWIRVGSRLADIHSSSAWCLGDWLVYGEASYGRRYREAIKQTSLDYQTLRNYAWVARRFSMSRRQDKLSFGHHAEVAALPEPEQDFWLRKVQELGWSVKQLRQQVHTSRSEHSDPVGEALPSDAGPGHGQGDQAIRKQRSTAQLSVHVTMEQLQSYEAAASTAEFALEEWAVLALDEAARRECAMPSASTNSD
jgi:hypothetical protein